MVTTSENKKELETQEIGRVPRTFPEFKLLLKGIALCLLLFILHSGSDTKLATTPALTASDSCYCCTKGSIKAGFAAKSCTCLISGTEHLAIQFRPGTLTLVQAPGCGCCMLYNGGFAVS